VFAGAPSWHNPPMASPNSLDQVLAHLRNLANGRRSRASEAAPLLARLLAPCETVAVEEHANGFAFRLQGTSELAAFSLTCVLHHPAGRHRLTNAERAVAEQLCEGRTLAQIAHLRGVSANTVKSQVRQIFRKLNVDSRVALVRRWCP
jgi:DNA-binding CsgD family transcriptional regulator